MTAPIASGWSESPGEPRTHWKAPPFHGARRQQSRLGPVFIPLWFAPGEAYQFDWSHEVVVLGGVTTTVNVAHIRLCHSRMFLFRAYPRETQEMVFDAHDRAFRLFGGMCRRGIYDNMTTAVEAVFVGKERRFNRRLSTPERKCIGGPE